VAKLYGYNPLFIYLTVRGSCESIAMALMYAFWYFYFGNNSSGNLIPDQIKDKKI
jgi:phosphatidylinositol glycan class M